jgi:hypothetical protein
MIALTASFSQNKIDVVTKKKIQVIITEAVLLLKNFGSFFIIASSRDDLRRTKKLIARTTRVIIINSVLPNFLQEKYEYIILTIATIKKDSDAEMASLVVKPGSFSLKIFA